MLSRAHHRDNACAAPQALFTPSQSLPAYQTPNSAVSRPSLSLKKLDLLCSALPATDHKTQLYIQDNMLISAPQEIVPVLMARVLTQQQTAREATYPTDPSFGRVT